MLFTICGKELYDESGQERLYIHLYDLKYDEKTNKLKPKFRFRDYKNTQPTKMVKDPVKRLTSIIGKRNDEGCWT
jgi:hypothetical protein